MRKVVYGLCNIQVQGDCVVLCSPPQSRLFPSVPGRERNTLATDRPNITLVLCAFISHWSMLLCQHGFGFVYVCVFTCVCLCRMFWYPCLWQVLIMIGFALLHKRKMLKLDCCFGIPGLLQWVFSYGDTDEIPWGWVELCVHVWRLGKVGLFSCVEFVHACMVAERPARGFPGETWRLLCSYAGLEFRLGFKLCCTIYSVLALRENKFDSVCFLI